MENRNHQLPSGHWLLNITQFDDTLTRQITISTVVKGGGTHAVSDGGHIEVVADGPWTLTIEHKRKDDKWYGTEIDASEEGKNHLISAKEKEGQDSLAIHITPAPFIKPAVLTPDTLWFPNASGKDLDIEVESTISFNLRGTSHEAEALDWIKETQDNISTDQTYRIANQIRSGEVPLKEDGVDLKQEDVEKSLQEKLNTVTNDISDHAEVHSIELQSLSVTQTDGKSEATEAPDKEPSDTTETESSNKPKPRSRQKHRKRKKGGS